MYRAVQTRSLSLALLLMLCSACGGDSDGDGESKSEPVAMLDESIGNAAADAFMLQLQLAHHLWLHIPRSHTLGPVDIREDGWGGGSFSVDGFFETQSKSVLNLDFAGYAFAGMASDARITVTGGGTIEHVPLKPPVVKLKNVTISNGFENFVVNASLQLEEDSVIADLSSDAGDAVWRGDLKVSTTETSNFRLNVSAAGKIELAGTGYVTIETPVPADLSKPINTTTNYGETVDGVFRLAGDGPARVTINLADGYAGSVNFDADGDGSHEKARRLVWARPDVNWTSGGVRPLPIAVARWMIEPPGTWTATQPQLGEVQQLDAASSIGARGELLSFSWEIWEKPDDSAATLENSESANPRFTPDVPGYYVFALHATSDHGQATDIITVAVSANDLPLPGMKGSLGSYFSAQPGDVVQLAYPLGSSSAWILSKPADSNAVLSDPEGHGLTIEFVPDVAGAYDVHGLRIMVGADRMYSQSFPRNTCLVSSIDFDGDGENDRIISDAEGEQLLFYASDPDDPRPLPRHITDIADLNDDSELEVLSQGGDGNTYLQVRIDYADADGNFKVASADYPWINGEPQYVARVVRLPDGTPRIFASTPYDAQPWREWRWTGAGLEETTQLASPDPFLHGFVHLDYDGDGLLDVASYTTLNQQVSEVTLWQGKADNTFERATTAEIDRGWSAAAFDLNADGRDELLITHPDSNESSGLRSGVYLYSNLSDDGFDKGTQIYPSSSVSHLKTTDINGDGRLDLAMVRTYPNTKAVMIYQAEDGSFTEKEEYLIEAFGNFLSSQRFELYWEDVNHDGLLDLLYGNSAAYGIQLESAD